MEEGQEARLKTKTKSVGKHQLPPVGWGRPEARGVPGGGESAGFKNVFAEKSSVRKPPQAPGNCEKTRIQGEGLNPRRLTPSHTAAHVAEVRDEVYYWGEGFLGK